jgi:hypothetical protein
MRLPKASRDLCALLRYLRGYKISVPRTLKVRYDPSEDERNLADPRGFAHVVRGRRKIYVAEAIENLPASARLGVLLHELGHFFAGADEVEADAWAKAVVPSYCYRKATYLQPTGDLVVASGLQCVGREDVERINAA